MKIKVGTVISGHIVYAVHANAYCIASPISQGGEYVVWHIDDDGTGVWGGSYYSDQMDAEWEYASKCFSWFQDNANISIDEDEDDTDETFEEFPDIP